jgi:hypothetical protein
VFLAIWALLLLSVGAILMAGHWIVLPTPDAGDEQLGAAVAGVTTPGDRRWQLTHVLYADCRCSQRIFEYLLTRPTPDGAGERVLLVGQNDDFAARARRRGIQLIAVTPQELKTRFHIESAPLLLITDPDGNLRYTGGYSTRKQGPDYRDVETLESLLSVGSARSLPLYGCGVSRDLQQLLDPLNVKYNR